MFLIFNIRSRNFFEGVNSKSWKIAAWIKTINALEISGRLSAGDSLRFTFLRDNIFDTFLHVFSSAQCSIVYQSTASIAHSWYRFRGLIKRTLSAVFHVYCFYFVSESHPSGQNEFLKRGTKEKKSWSAFLVHHTRWFWQMSGFKMYLRMVV